MSRGEELEKSKNPISGGGRCDMWAFSGGEAARKCPVSEVGQRQAALAPSHGVRDADLQTRPGHPSWLFSRAPFWWRKCGRIARCCTMCVDVRNVKCDASCKLHCNIPLLECGQQKQAYRVPDNRARFNHLHSDPKTDRPANGLNQLQCPRRTAWIENKWSVFALPFLVVIFYLLA
jgi:hypothetical protein